MRLLCWLLLCLALVSSVACTSEQAAQGPPARLRTSGGALALSRDERIAVATNRSSGAVTIFTLDPSRGVPSLVTRAVELDTGKGSEPWSAVIGPDGDTAYVVLRKAHKVLRIRDLRTASPKPDGEVDVHAEPTAIAISPSGTKLWVANWGEGTVSILTTDPFESPAYADLNVPLAASGLLGDVGDRSGLAHPYALALTDDGDADDDDETLYATEFFSQPLPNVADEPDLSHVDRNRQGLVYTVSLRSGQAGASVISIAPRAVTGFTDSDGRMTSCFPNQLYAAAVFGTRLYVTGMCASPRGPLGSPANAPSAANFKTLVHPAVFAIDIANGTNAELPEQGRLLTRVLSDHYEAGESDVGARMPLIPNDIAFDSAREAGPVRAYVSALGADAVFRLDYDAGGQLLDIGSPGARFIDMKASLALPIGVVASRSSNPPFVLALNDGARQLSIVDPRTEQVTPLAALPTLAPADDPSFSQLGRGLFATGLDVWSYRGQAWSSCESCHPGGMSDGVTWFFSRGPRRTLSPASTYDKVLPESDRRRRLMLWGANIDEVHDIEAIARDVSGGVGGVIWRYSNPGDSNNGCRLLYNGNPTKQATDVAVPPCDFPKRTTLRHNGLNGSLASLRTGPPPCAPDVEACDAIASPDWDQIDAFIRSLRAPVAPTRLLPSSVEAGRRAFVAGRCNGCHAGPGWTVSTSFYTPGPDENGALPYAKDSLTEPPPLGALRDPARPYAVPDLLAGLNPAAAKSERTDCPTGTHCTTYRVFAPADTSSASMLDAAYDGAVAPNDQLRCALRDVGTFPPPASEGPPLGLTAPGAPRVFEYRQDMRSLAQGADGMNVPSLFGMAVGAPYFHAGNARTLEELFDSTFASHHGALAPDFLSDETSQDRINYLVAFLLSIDETSSNEPLLETAADGSALNHDFCKR